jgi:ubiquinol-cytochrome c reductase cytochrome b subunit
LSDPDEEQKADLANIIVALSAEAGLKAQAEVDARDAEQIAAGREAIADDFGFDCISCHKFHDQGSKGPDLTGYGSREWQIAFIQNAAHPRFYGSRNDRMAIFGPKYREDGSVERPAQLTDGEIGLLVDWLRGDWYEPAAEEPKEGDVEAGP